MNTEISDFLSVLRFLRYLRKHFPVLILCAVLASVLGYFYIDSSRKYSSSARFIVNNLPGTNTPETIGADNDLKAMKSNSMQLFFSTEVINRVMERLDLYPCYHVNRNNVHGRERLIRAIRASIQFKLEKIGGHELIVTTYDRSMSAAIANALIDETDKLNGKLLNEEVIRKADIMDNLIQRSNINMSGNVDSLSKLTKLLEAHKAKSSQQDDLETRMYNALALLQQNLETMSRTRDYYDIILKSNLSNNFHFFYVVAQAVPDYRNYLQQNILIALVLGFSITFVITMTVYYIQRQFAKVRALGLYPEKVKVLSEIETEPERPDEEESIIRYPAKVT